MKSCQMKNKGKTKKEGRGQEKEMKDKEESGESGESYN
jgi:hypothetical protein